MGTSAEESTEDEYHTYFKECLKTLREKRGNSRDTQIRELLATYYTIHQQPRESVADFSHRFCEVQHQLQKLLPGIHKLKSEDGAGEDLELIYAFTIKLCEDIAAELVSREFKYSSLQSVTDAARRYEEHRPNNVNSLNATPTKTDHAEQQTIGPWQPEALYHQSQNGISITHSNETSHPERSTLRPSPKSRIVTQPSTPRSPSLGFPGKSSRQPFSQSINFVSQAGKFKQPSAHRDVSSEICFMFNKRYKSNCELSDNKCKYGRQHVCQVCSKFGCKKVNHQTKIQQTGNIHDKSVCQPQAHQACTYPSGHQSQQIDSYGQVLNLLQSMTANIQSLNNGMEKIEVQSTAPQPQPLSSSDSGSVPVYGCPAITAIPGHLQVPGLDLQNKHILWTPITSAGVSLPLPIDSCCSISLVSQAHADFICQKCPNLTFTKLPNPIPVAVATPVSKLSTVGVLQVPIIWENGRPSVFSMLVVPGLSWLILFGQHHFRMTQAHTDHAELTVHFRDPALGFTIKCRDSNPLQAFPSLSSPPVQTGQKQESGEQPFSRPSVNVTRLLTAFPPPTQSQRHVILHKGYNLVSFCLVLATSLIGSCLFTAPLGLEGRDIMPGVHAVSGPIDLANVSSVHTIPPDYNRPKCRPSQPCVVDEPNVPQPAILMSDTDFGSIREISNIPALSQTYYTNVLIYSTKDKISLPFNASVEHIRTCTPADERCFSEAIDHTAAQLADSCFTFATLNAHVDPEPNNISRFYSRLPPQASVPHRPWQVKDQQQEMVQAGLDSSILAPFLPEPDIPHPSEFPPTGPIYLDPKSDEYFEKVAGALELDGPLYSHVDPKLREEFKALVKKYSEIFDLPGSPLGIVKSFYHNIDTGTSPPMYKLPYCKSFSEMCAIKKELERMLKLNIIQPSTSA